METSTCLETTQHETTHFTVQLLIGWPWSVFSCAPEQQKRLGNGRILGHHINAKISPNAASEKAQTTVSDNRYTSDDWFFSDGHFITSSVGVVFGTPGTAYFVPPLPSCGVAACLHSFPSTFECLIIPWLLTYSINSQEWLIKMLMFAEAFHVDVHLFLCLWILSTSLLTLSLSSRFPFPPHRHTLQVPLFWWSISLVWLSAVFWPWKWDFELINIIVKSRPHSHTHNAHMTPTMLNTHSKEFIIYIQAYGTCNVTLGGKCLQLEYVVRSERVKLRAPELTGIPVHLPNPNPYPKFSSAVLSHHSVVGQSGATYSLFPRLPCTGSMYVFQLE